MKPPKYSVAWAAQCAYTRSMYVSKLCMNSLLI